MSRYFLIDMDHTMAQGTHLYDEIVVAKGETIEEVMKALGGYTDETTTVYNSDEFGIPAPGFYDLTPGRYVLSMLEASMEYEASFGDTDEERDQ